MNGMSDGESIRGVVLCQSCGWYVGRRLLRRDEGVCPVCDAEVDE